MHGLAPSERPVAPNRLTENKGCIKHRAVAHGNGARRGQALIVLHLDGEDVAAGTGLFVGRPGDASGRRLGTRHTCWSVSA